MKNSYQLKISAVNFSSFKVIEKILVTLQPSVFCSVSLPKKLKRFVFIRSPHVNSVSKEHFKILKHQKFFSFNLEPDKLRQFLLQIPHDVSFRIKHKLSI